MKATMMTRPGVTAVMLANTALAASKASDCCQALAAVPQLQDKLYYPDDLFYDERMTTYWSLSAALEPWCMVLPETADDVSATITTVAKNECPFGIRGGGHGTHALSNSLEQGVTIDMGLFNTTTYDPATKLASIGPGAHWGDVYAALTPHGVTAPGGRAASVGVGGFLLGGGNSFHSGSHGFGCDSVVSFEVVLADGRVVNASGGAGDSGEGGGGGEEEEEEEEDHHHSDLWKALKGGSGNFGLVTRFDMRAIEFPDDDGAPPHIWGGIVGYEYGVTGAIIDAFVDFAAGVADDVYSSSIMGWGYDASAGGFSIRCVLDNVANVAYPAAFDGYLAVEGRTSSSLRSATMENITAELVRDYRTHTIWFTGTYKSDARILNFISAKHEAMMLAIEAALGGDPASTGLFSSCQAQPMTESMISRGAGSNVLGLEERLAELGGEPGFMFLVYVGVETAEDERLALPFVEAFHAEVEEYAAALGGNWDWHYLNYAYGTQDPITGYGEESVRHLREVAEKYDPEGVFHRLRGSGFKIPM